MPFRIVRNDIVHMQVDAIVNTANPEPIYGPGTDAQVYQAAGIDSLLAKRREIGRIEPGDAAITSGFNLLAKYIIHAVGTYWNGGNNNEEEIIRQCYRKIFSLALENGIESVATPLLASGNYGFPKGIALRIALSEIESFLQDHELDIVLVVYDKKSFELTEEFYGDIDSYINDNYVDNNLYPASPLGRTIPSDMMAGQLMARPMMAASETNESSNGEETVKPKRKLFKEKAKTSKLIDFDHVVEECAYAPTMAPVRSLDDVIKNLDKTFMEMVFSFADERGMTDVEVQKNSNLDRKAFSKLKCGTTKNPSKSTALALAIGLRLNLDETRDLLSRAGYALSPCNRQDLIVRYFIEREAYDIYSINVALFEHGEGLLGSQA